jgi:hypothetical protein
VCECPLHPGGTLNAVVTFDPGKADLSSDQFNGRFESVSGAIGAIGLTHGGMATGPFPDSSNFFSGNVGGEPAGFGPRVVQLHGYRPATFGDRSATARANRSGLPISRAWQIYY